MVKYVAVLSLVFPVQMFAMGLGDISVTSYLDQPFHAEIELIDVGSTPLSDIKVSLAPIEEYKTMGLERINALNLLQFKVVRNAQAKVVIEVLSTERISEPYMQLLVDLAWANGQDYRAYTILLDPPHYKINTVKKQLHHLESRQFGGQSSISSHESAKQTMNHSKGQKSISVGANVEKETVYGPTSANETIWQIAQRYKSDDTLLQQMILAIVGTNPEAFTEGNLNGLKKGSYLTIPNKDLVNKVPQALSKTEVLAHDKAWQSRQPIEHTLLPPYINSTAPMVVTHEQEISPLGYPLTHSLLPSISSLIKTGLASDSNIPPLSSSLLSHNEGEAISAYTQDLGKMANSEQAKVKAELDLVASAIASVRETNAQLIEQVRSLHAENKRLKQQLTLRLQMIRHLQKQNHLNMERQGVLGQVSQSSLQHESHPVWFLILFLLLLGIGGAGGYWLFWMQRDDSLEKNENDQPNESPSPFSSLHESPMLQSPPIEPISQESLDEEADTEAVSLEISTHKSKPSIPSPTTEEPHEPERPKSENLVFENPVSESPVSESPASESPVSENPVSENPVAENPIEDEHLLEFEPGLLPKTEKTEDEPLNIENEEQVLEFDFSEELPSTETEKTETSASKTPKMKEEKPLKSKAALDTLLQLAKTYIGMEDLDSAKQFLTEVMTHGDKTQKEEAARLLDEINKK